MVNTVNIMELVYAKCGFQHTGEVEKREDDGSWRAEHRGGGRWHTWEAGGSAPRSRLVVHQMVGGGAPILTADLTGERSEGRVGRRLGDVRFFRNAEEDLCFGESASACILRGPQTHGVETQ
jgi:hypothetical protein